MGAPGQPVATNVDDIESDEETAGDIPAGAPRRGRRLLHRNKQINSLQEALNAANYDPLTMPTAAEEKVLSAVLVHKKRRQPEERVEWTNVKGTNAGRLPR